MTDEYDAVPLNEYEVLAKKSHVNACFTNLGVEFVDDLQNLVFLRILRVGSGLTDSRELRRGHLISIHKGAGRTLGPLTMAKRCGHYVVKKEDVVALIREFDED